MDTVPERSVHFRLQATTVRGHRRCVRYGGATFYRGKGTGGRPLPRYDGTNGTARQRFTSVTVQGLSAYPANGNGSLPLPNVPWQASSQNNTYTGRRLQPPPRRLGVSSPGTSTFATRISAAGRPYRRPGPICDLPGRPACVVGRGLRWSSPVGRVLG